MDYKKPITELLDKVRKAYIEDQQAKGIRSSGKSADSLKIEAGTTSGTLTGVMYFRQQRDGRKPGKFPPISAILDWIRAKGIQPIDITERSLAFLIARKIARQGTDIYQGKREGLDPDEQIEKFVEEFRKNIVSNFRTEVVKSLKAVSQ